ncbi:hypothetical protein SAMN04488543_2806 [Friedmanniella luteola]|uniref:DUF4913 domain-containing protein n=2 Tax=Friedmanniella luteola TaxID=546871 RepID=A0A1H1WU50_9ACTN|nr:hypothetical protein SAMN04488543_2806 [Friedmanniella luteola]
MQPPGTRPRDSTPMVLPFPRPGRLIQDAYQDLEVAANSSLQRLSTFSGLDDLPRPWDPARCTDRDLRLELWAWLDAVVSWHNHQQVWDAHATIPACWPHHPHLVHQIAVLADQRHHAGQALTSDLLEDWHRYTLPAFTDRMNNQLREHCADSHQPWPAQGRHSRYQAESSRAERQGRFESDTSTWTFPQTATGGRL